MLKILSILLLLASFLGLTSPLLTPLFTESVPKLAWLLDLASHWQWLYGLLLVLSILFLASQQKWWLLALITLALPLVTASPVLSSTTTHTHTFKILSSNVYLDNPDLNRLKILIDQEQPDVIVLLEFSPQHLAPVKTWTAYPHQILQARSGAFGMAILSRFALSETQIITDSLGIEHIRTQVQASQPFQLVGFHPLPPVSEQAYRVRDQLLQDLTKPPHQQPRIIAGDFNATPWSSAFQGLAKRGYYRSVSLLPTWPTKLRGIIGIPIDQVLASSHWQLLTTRIGSNIGSDHYPIIVELSL
ncbi:endonuclease/exonuclease/phosphatase family protein [uncultured Thiothrix sp.]|uniref:endonuclease/exonuclease/phosphatase family protein n=1 Tax=uncultured Thiothrix sp. TaxID=223185 RepID=UPI002620015B|nr:endonuclease/exonuclease/phosphatase family protein [uncultured Thiothrix sp.]HMT91513.1 endonuclease/exonuclease/phosphatase family protein [Thiolinea sp.]